MLLKLAVLESKDKENFAYLTTLPHPTNLNIIYRLIRNVAKILNICFLEKWFKAVLKKPKKKRK